MDLAQHKLRSDRRSLKQSYLIQTRSMLAFTFDNITGFLFAFIPGLFSIGLVIYILVFLPRNRLADIFALLTLSGAMWQMGDAAARISANVATADILDNFFSIGWIFIGALCLHFTLLYAKLISEAMLPWALSALYIPSFAFQSIYQGRYFPHEFKYRTFWGWVNYHDSATIDKVMVWWISASVLCSCVLLFYYAFRVREDKLLYSQALIIATGIAIPTIGGVTAQVILPTILKQPAIPVTSYFLTFLTVATIIALNRYRLFTISELLNNELLLDDLPVTVLSISDTGHVTYVNEYGANLLGINRESLRKSRYNQLMLYALPEHERNFSTAFQRALDGEYMYDVESALIVDDKTLNVMMSASPIINNKRVRGVLFCIRDVTELKASAEHTARSETSLKEAQRISHIGSWEWDLATNKITWTDELYRIYGLEPGQEIRYETIATYTDPDDVQTMRDQLQLVSVALQPVNFVYKIKDTTGTLKYLNARLRAIEDDQAGVARVFGTVQDITQQVKTETTLQQKNVELTRSNANLEEFLFVASHDLKEPVRKIITFADLVMKTELNTLSEKGQGHFDRMISAARRMQKMIDELLSLSLIGHKAEFQQCKLNCILHEVIEELDLKIKEKHATIEADELPCIEANPTQFKQLFMNLISNSLKFAKQDTPPVVKVQCRRLKPKELGNVPLFSGTSYIKITINDNGIGFENLYADKIFLMFQRLHGKVDFEGTGIGLAVCKKIVENHKGAITAKGIPGVGATFEIIVPAVHQPGVATAHT